MSTESPRSRPVRKSADNRRDADEQWLIDCGWSGWGRDEFTGVIYTHHGETFASARELRRWLESLPCWPKTRNVPRRGSEVADVA